MNKRKILIAMAGIVVTIILVGVLLFVAFNQDHEPNVDPTEDLQTTEAPTEVSTEATAPETEDVNAPKTANSLIVSAFDGEKDEKYLEKYGLSEYQAPFAVVERVDGMSYIDIGDGVEIYREGVFAGWFAAWDFSDVSELSEDKVISEETIDAYIEQQFGVINAMGTTRTGKEILTDGVVRYDYAVKLLVQEGDDWLVTSGIYNSEKDMLERGTYTLNVSAYCEPESNYGYILCTEGSAIDGEKAEILADAISFWKSSFSEARTTLESGNSAQQMHTTVKDNYPAVINYMEMCQWFRDYNGEKLHRIPGTVDDNYSPAICPDIIYYRPDSGESMDAIVRAMFKAIMEPLKKESTARPFTVTKYFLAQQEIENYEGRKNTWLLPYLNGYYAYTGTDVVTMEVAKTGSRVQEGMVELFRQGSDEEFQFVLVREGNVYRLQRAIDMGLQIETKEK